MSTPTHQDNSRKRKRSSSDSGGNARPPKRVAAMAAKVKIAQGYSKRKKDIDDEKEDFSSSSRVQAQQRVQNIANDRPQAKRLMLTQQLAGGSTEEKKQADLEYMTGSYPKRHDEKDTQDKPDDQQEEVKETVAKKRQQEESSKNIVGEDKVPVGIVTWNIAHLGGSKKDREEGKGASLKNEKKVKAIADMFKNNMWLDIMVLQEVNNLEYFEELLEKNAKELKIVKGGQQQLAALRKTGGAGQSEVYLVVVRKNSNWKIARVDNYYPMDEDGMWVEQDEKKAVLSEFGETQVDYEPFDPDKEEPMVIDETDEEYVEELKEALGTKEYKKYTEKERDKKYNTWLENNEDKDIWRDWGSNLDLSLEIDEGHEAVMKYLKKNYELSDDADDELASWINKAPSEKKNDKPNKIYYKELLRWTKDLLDWLRQKYEEEDEEEDDTLKSVENQIQNVEQLVKQEAREKESYRPIQRYYLTNEAKDVTLVLNVVHTTPSTEGKTKKGKNRKKVFSQVAPVLDDMEQTQNLNEITIGDVYINEKDTVEDKKTLKKVLESKKMKIAADTTAHTNLWSRGKVYNQADIIVVHYKTDITDAGIVMPKGGLDKHDKYHSNINFWTDGKRSLSDHAPVGAQLNAIKGKHEVLYRYASPDEETSKDAEMRISKKAKKNPSWDDLGELVHSKFQGQETGERKRPGREKQKLKKKKNLQQKESISSRRLPKAPTQRANPERIRAYLTTLSADWDKPFGSSALAGNSGSGGIITPNAVGFMANQIGKKTMSIAGPVTRSSEQEQNDLQAHNLNVLSNRGEGALCFVYSVVMGLTGLSESEVAGVVDRIARRAKVPKGWIAADSPEAARVINEIDSLFNTQVSIIVVSHGRDGTIISGRAGAIGGTPVLIRQTAFHYDAYVAN